MEDENKVQEGVADAVVVEEIAPDSIALKDEEIAKLKKERDNYKTVALKRLGKLPGDAEFIEQSSDSGLTVEEQVKQALIEREIAKAEAEKEAETRKLVRENAELKLALKNRPSSDSLGGDTGANGVEVKDNILSATQISELTKRAEMRGVDPQEFIKNFKQNLQRRS